MIPVRQANVFDFCSCLNGFGRSLYGKVFYDDNRIPILQHIAIGIQYSVGCIYLIGIPLMTYAGRLYLLSNSTEESKKARPARGTSDLAALGNLRYL